MARPDPLDRAEAALGGGAGDPLAAVERALAGRGQAPPPKNRAARRSKGVPNKAGAGKHPLGATKPLRSEKAEARRKRKRSR